MASKYNPGDTVYIVESSRFIREVKVLRIVSGFAALRFTDTNGGIKIHESRLFPTKEEAEASIKKKPTKGHPL